MTQITIRLRTSLAAVALGAMCGAFTLHAPGAHSEASGTDEHAAHHVAAGPALQIATAEYEVPDVTLEDERGRPVKLRQILASDHAVVVNFIFTSCATVCPVMTATLLQLQRELKDTSPAPRYISVSIDPDYDSANVLNDYAKRSHADWTFLSGERDSVLDVLRAFGAWRGGKANHVPLTLLRRPGETQWTRVEGLTTAHKLAELWRGGAS